VVISNLLICAFLGMSICISCVLLSLLRFVARQRDRVAVAVIGLTIVHEFALVLYPLWFDICSGGSERYSGLDIGFQDQLIVYLGETLFVLSFAFGFMYWRSSPKCAARRGSTLGEERLVQMLLWAGLLFYVVILFSRTYEIQDVLTHQEVIIRTRFWDYCVAWAEGFIRWPSLVAAGLVIANPKAGRVARAVALLMLLAQAIVGLVNGYRGNVLWPVVCVVAGAVVYEHGRVLRSSIVFTLVLVPISPWLHDGMRYLSYSAPPGTRRIDMIPTLIRGLTQDALKPGMPASELGSSIASRAQGPVNSTTLYRLHDTETPAGIGPIIGAIVLPIPRGIWPEKPVAGSTDSTNVGAAIYRVQRAKVSSRINDMGPVLASAHAYWEGGWFWLLVAGGATGAFWRFMLLWAWHRRDRQFSAIVVLSLLPALPVDGLLGAFNPVYTFVRLVWVTIVPMLLLRKGFELWERRSKRAGEYKTTVASTMTCEARHQSRYVARY